MLFQNYVKAGIVITAIIVVLITFIALAVFAMQPLVTIHFTNILLLVLILVQLFSVSVLMHIYGRLVKIYEKIGRKRR